MPQAPRGKACKAAGFSISRRVTAGGRGFGPKTKYFVYDIVQARTKANIIQTNIDSKSSHSASQTDDSCSDFEENALGLTVDWVDSVANGEEQVEVSYGGTEAELIAETLQKALYTL